MRRHHYYCLKTSGWSSQRECQHRRESEIPHLHQRTQALRGRESPEPAYDFPEHPASWKFGAPIRQRGNLLTHLSASSSHPLQNSAYPPTRLTHLNAEWAMETLSAGAQISCIARQDGIPSHAKCTSSPGKRTESVSTTSSARHAHSRGSMLRKSPLWRYQKIARGATTPRWRITQQFPGIDRSIRQNRERWRTWARRRIG